MKKLNLVFFATERWEQKYLQEKLQGLRDLNLIFSPNPLRLRGAKKYKKADAIAIFIYSKITEKIIATMPHLKYIATMSTGFDHIDLKACQARNVKVSNVPYYGENTVAEHTFALIFALSRRIPESIERVIEGNFSPEGLMGFDLNGKTIGLVGLGHIGEYVAKIAHSLEMKILAYDIKKNSLLAKKYQIKYCTLDYLLKHANIISLHAPLNKHTHHIINEDNIKKMKKGSYIINTSRGGLIDTDALIMALDRKIIAGAGLDVLEEEPFIREEKELLAKSFKKKCNLRTVLQDHALITNPKVLVTPHNAFNSREALERILDTTVDNIKAFTKNKFINIVK